MATFMPKVMRLVRIHNLQTGLICAKTLPVGVQVCSFHETNPVLSEDAGTSKEASKRLQTKPTTKAISISRSMRAYMSRAKAHNDMMAAEVADYEIGKRHLANIMGEDPDSFTQEDVDRAIEYLLPSGLYDKRARPMMKNPYEIFPKRKDAQFGLDGKPYHYLYFTTLPNYYELLHQITWKMEGLKKLEDQLRAEKRLEEETDSGAMILTNSEWIKESVFRDMLVEKTHDKEYQHFLVLMERLASHPLAFKEEDFIMKFRKEIVLQTSMLETPAIEVDSDGRAFATAEGRRKRCSAIVHVYKPGTGKFNINDKDLSFFSNLLYRESLAVPLIVTGLLGHVDVEARVEPTKGGPTAHAGAIRSGLAVALQAFVDDVSREQLRLAGLLTTDPRTKERKKPGQEKARKKFTWKKR